MQQAGYHRENMLATQLRESMISCDTSMLAMVQEFTAATTEADLIDNPPQIQTVNIFSQDTIQLEILILRYM